MDAELMVMKVNGICRWYNSNCIDDTLDGVDDYYYCPLYIKGKCLCNGFPDRDKVRQIVGVVEQFEKDHEPRNYIEYSR